MKKWLKEPLVHFCLIGAAIFILFSIVNNDENIVSTNKIVISSADIARLSNNWSRKWNRPPTKAELHGLIQAHIREEVYYREALALGLDQNDTILRRRLMQKMEFLTNDLAELNTPDETKLKKYFIAHQDKYKQPARVSFTHVYFSVNKRGEKVVDDVKDLLSELRSTSESILRAPERGDSFLLGYDFSQGTPTEVAHSFGKSFADQLFKSDIKAWQGPIESGYGIHLVRINERIKSRLPEFASVIDKVRVDWTYEQRQKTNKEIYKRLKDRYEIVIEELPRASGVAKAIISDKDAL